MKINHKPKNALITGSNGFIGHNFVKYFLKKNNKAKIFCIDKITKHSIKKNKIKFSKFKNYKFIRCDINNSSQIKSILEKYSINTVINFAAESHVDRSIDSPKKFYINNTLGTINLANLCNNQWSKINLKNTRFIQISTDEVFGSILGKKSAVENSKYNPSSPYSSSKSSADLGLLSFIKTYKFPVNIVYMCNNFGPYQNYEKFIPTVIQSCLKKIRIPVYGSGKNIRQWIFVEEACEAIYRVLIYGKKFENYNIGSKSYFTNIFLAKKICEIFSKKIDKNFNFKKLIEFIKDRPGHDFRYSLNSKKIKKNLKWKSKRSFLKDLETTIDWYLNDN